METSEFDTARQLVSIVEQLANYKEQLLREAKGGSVDEQLVNMTWELGLIANRLFKYSLTSLSGEQDTIASSSGERQIVEDAVMPDNQMKAARICQFGIQCAYGERGICGFYHPEEGKSRERVSTFTQALIINN